MVDLSVEVGGLRLKNPVIAAAGTFGFGTEYARLYDVGLLGGICTKGLTLKPRPGNPPPRLWETPCGLLNSIGLENPGVEAFLQEELPRMRGLGTAVIANIWGETPEEYRELAERLSRSDVDAIELNLSCPNVPGGKIRGGVPEEVARIVGLCRRVCEKPLWVKLPPEGDVLEAAQAAERAGADAVTASNTFRALAIDIEKGRPAFAGRIGGLSGPAIKPIALRVVYELVQKLKLPVIGCGGITSWQDALEFIMAGAHAVQVGTGNFIDPLCIPKIVRGLADWLAGRGMEDLEGVRGCAH
ncbi:TPA: dihydroorotate dehydrogenase [Candidatus Acetothermia bacterium]|nr:dihydroorotate dehydrogenase [Candidatus Acetothermia bacterium]